MGRFDAEIDKYFGNDVASRAIAQAFCDRFEGQPFSERAIPAMLSEAAQINTRVMNGELSPLAGRELLISTAVEGYGLPPAIVEQGKSFLNEVAAAAEGGEEAETQADASGPWASLINKLYPPEDRLGMNAIAARMDADPRTARWTEPFLVEAAKNPDPIYIRSWLANTGYPESLIDSTLAAGVEPHFEQVAQQRLDELVGDVTPEARFAGAQARRDAAAAVIDRGNAAMRTPQGSPEWTWYHRGGGAQAYYHALQDREATGDLLAAAVAAAPPVAPPTAPSAEPAPAPAPAAEPAAPA